MRRVVALVLATSCLAFAQTPAASPLTPYERKASETDKPAVFGYMISDFFHQRYAEGPRPLWHTVGWLAMIDLLLLADLTRRRGWRR